VLGKTKLPDKPSITVRDYLRLAHAAAMTAHASRGNAVQQSVARHTAALLRDARVFHLNPASYFAAYRAADVYVTTSLAGLPWREGLGTENGVLTLPETQTGRDDLAARIEEAQRAQASADPIADSERLLTAMEEGQLQEPFPSPLPFPTLHIGFGGTIALTPGQMAIALGESTVTHHDTSLGGHHLGYTLGHTEEHGDIVLEHLDTPDGSGPITIARYFDGAWVGLMSLSPWVVNSLIALINENRTIVEEQPVTPAMRYEHQRIKIDRLIPRPYYTLRLKSQVIDESMKRSATLSRYTFHYTYRFDVAGHERLRVQRGEGLLDERTRKKLIERKYVIYEPGTPLDEVLMKKLDVRGYRRPAPTEWIAVLTSQIGDHVKGPKDAPYVPAVRVVPAVA